MKKLMFIFIFIAMLLVVNPVNAGTVKHTKISHNSSCDIVLKDIKTDPIIFRNQTVKSSSKLKNLGSKPCKEFYMDYFLKSVDTGQNIYLGSIRIGGLRSLESRVINSSFNVPKTIRNTDYYLRIVLDSKNVLNETNKTNKVVYSQKKLSLVTGRPVYITSDHIKNNDADNSKVDAIVNGLKKRGLYAVNYGLGPNKHYSVLKNVKVPQNALIVNIYGGVCAGTIWEMAQTYYKKALGSRKVFSIWINTNVDVRTVKFLKRASDDNDTPMYGEKGGFPQFQDDNHNGIFEPNLGEKDGLTNPGKLLDKNGYKYLYQQDGNVEKIVEAIYSQATS
jgi:hypothetical protein